VHRSLTARGCTKAAGPRVIADTAGTALIPDLLAVVLLAVVLERSLGVCIGVGSVFLGFKQVLLKLFFGFPPPARLVAKFPGGLGTAGVNVGRAHLWVATGGYGFGTIILGRGLRLFVHDVPPSGRLAVWRPLFSGPYIRTEKVNR